MKKFLCLSLVCVSRGLRGNLLTRLHSYRARDSGINFARRRVISQMTGNNFESLGVVENLRKGLSSQDIETPTPVQRSVIPRLMQRENVLIAATTGSGKTLSYVLPTIQSLCFAEDQGYVRKKCRPRVIVLVPTRELAQQVLQTFKSLSHYAKISSCAVFGGEQYQIQKKKLDHYVDVVVASPGRLRKHKEQGNVFFSEVDTVIIDEVDTMLHQGFGADVRYILKSAMMRKGKNVPWKSPTGTVETSGNLKGVQVVMATATLTKAVDTLAVDMKGGFNTQDKPSGSQSKKNATDDLDVKFNIIKVDGLHRTSSNVSHTIEPLHGNQDKISLLLGVLNRNSEKHYKSAIFCNSIVSCQAVTYALNESGYKCDSYHGDLNSRMRVASLESFREGKTQYLVCTDIASRGLDILDLDHVVMFDFPLNPIDYLHRSGRCGRMGSFGLVTSIVTKKDRVLSSAILRAIQKNLPLENLSSNKRDYMPGGRLHHLVK